MSISFHDLTEIDCTWNPDSGNEGREEIKTSAKALQLRKCAYRIDAEIAGMPFNAEMADMQQRSARGRDIGTKGNTSQYDLGRLLFETYAL